MRLKTTFNALGRPGALLYLCILCTTGFSQSNDLRFRSEMLVAKEAFAENNLESAQAHLNKAAKFADDTTKMDEVDRFYIQMLVQQDKLIDAESILERLTARNPTLVVTDRDFAELTFVITDGAAAQHRKRAQMQEERKAWDATAKDNFEQIKAYLAQYPGGHLTELAQQRLAACYIAQKKPLRPDDLSYLQWWEHENIENDFRDSVYAVVVQDMSELPGYPHLLGIAVQSDSILFSKQKTNPLSRPDVQYLSFESCIFDDGKAEGPLAPAQLTQLSIKSCNLKKFSALNQPNLMALDVSDNLLTKLPRLTGFEPLEKINASYNQMSDFPDDVLDIKNLKELELGHNLFSSIPEKIVKLKSLRFLDISDNTQIKNLPISLFALSGLETLYLHGLGVSVLPPGIQQLSGLKHLSLGGELQAMPAGVEELSNLEALYLIGVKKMKTFPEVISKFKKLQVLYIDGNPWEKVPDQLSSLRRIKDLYLVNFNLIDIPEVAYKLPNLRVLNLSGNPIALIPERISELKHLEEINVSGATLSKADLLRLRMALPGTRIIYRHPVYNKVLTSEALPEDQKGLNLSNSFQYFKEGDLSSTYELGKFFENREDYGMAYLFYSQAMLNTKLVGRGRVLISQLAMAELGQKMYTRRALGPLQKSPDSWDKTINKFLDIPSIREFEVICNCSPRDEQAEQIKKKACAEAYQEYKAAVIALDRYKEYLMDEAERLIPGARQKLASAENWVIMGQLFDLVASSNLAGWGGVVGGTVALIKGNAAEKKAAQAAAIKTQLEQIQKRIDQIKDKIENLGFPRA